MPGELIPRTNVPNDRRLMLEELWQVVNEIVDLLNSIKAEYEAHTHNANGAQAGSYFTSPPRTDAATVTAGTASAVNALPAKMTH